MWRRGPDNWGEAVRPKPGDGIRASDQERDATVERLRDGTGEGRVTLGEFRDRMERASTAKTRAELDVLLTDLPAAGGPVPAGNAVATGAPATPTWHVSPIGGLNGSGPWRVGGPGGGSRLLGGGRPG